MTYCKDEDAKKDRQLVNELRELVKNGVKLSIDNQSDYPESIAMKVQFAETCSYMRDYITENGAVKEVRFDRINL